jgi:hypothetical protein
MMREKARPDRTSGSKVMISRNNQNMIAVVAVRRDINDDILSRE